MPVIKFPKALTAVMAAAIAGCTGGASPSSVSISSVAPPPTYSVGGTVSGLSGSGLVLQDNSGDNLAVSANGAFTFPTALASGGGYNVSVLVQPGSPTQTCVASNAVGSIAAANVTNVAVACTTKSTALDAIGGTVTGLAGTGLVLQDNGGDNLAISGNGPFTFATSLASGTAYSVTVLSPPINPNQNCTVSSGGGTTGASDVNNVAVTCTTTPSNTASYTIAGAVTGLPAGGTLVLEDNGRDDQTITANGSFTFATPIPSGSAYSVTAKSVTGSQSVECSITNASGIVGNANVTNVAVACSGSTPVLPGLVWDSITATWDSATWQ